MTDKEKKLDELTNANSKMLLDALKDIRTGLIDSKQLKLITKQSDFNLLNIKILQKEVIKEGSKQ